MIQLDNIYIQNYEKNFVGFGDPVILNNSTFSELPNTRDELISLALSSNANREDIYLREDANVENFRKGQQKLEREFYLIFGRSLFNYDTFLSIKHIIDTFGELNSTKLSKKKYL